MTGKIENDVRGFARIVSESSSYEEIRSKLGYKPSGYIGRLIKSKCEKHGIDYSHITSKRGPKPSLVIDLMFDDVLVKKMIPSATSFRDLALKLGLDYDAHPKATIRALRAFVNKHEIDTAHFTGYGWAHGKTRFDDVRVKKLSITMKTPWEEVFKKRNISSVGNKGLIERLVESGKIKYRCQGCGKYEWNNKPLRLHLDHIDGDNFNCLESNLRLLCPNCHSQTPTYCRGMKTQNCEAVDKWIKNMISLSFKCRLGET